VQFAIDYTYALYIWQGVHMKLWTLSRKVNPDAFLDKAMKTTRTTKKISKNRNKIMQERSILLIDLLPVGTYTLALFMQLDTYLFTTWLVTYMDSTSRSLFIFNS
jgi:hypothetical protein